MTGMDHAAVARAIRTFSRGAFLARRALAPEPVPPQLPPTQRPPGPRRRNILFVTTDQQRYDALGITGHPLARTPVVDGLARAGVLYRCAHVQSVVCMPSRATMLTGQHPLTHGVVSNGIPLDDASPNVARLLRAAGYCTALLGKAHFDPHLDLLLRFPENRRAAERDRTPWRGFDHVEFAAHGPVGGHHYAAWLWEQHPEDVAGFGAVLTGAGGGDTGAPEVAHNPIARAHYHTDWVADRTIAWLRSLDPGAPFFCWMSFPDPHHPFDPPREEVLRRGDFRGRPLPRGHPGSPERARAILAQRPRHWLDYYDGRFRNPEGGPTSFVPAHLTHDQLREIDHVIQVENELIDEALGRVLAALGERGLDEHTDVFFTSDHGDLGGHAGLLYKGPYHVEALLRVPLVWRPAPSAGVAPAVVDEPVGHVDLAPTFCAIAGIEAAAAMQGEPLPVARGSRRERVITTFDSQFARVGMHLRTIYRDGMICTAYEPSTRDRGGRFPVSSALWLRGSRIPRYDGSEGELYDVRDDPEQWENLWDDPSRRRLRDDLCADLRAHLPEERLPRLRVAAPT
jgi:arylsulfatase A-like enzyme